MRLRLPLVLSLLSLLGGSVTVWWLSTEASAAAELLLVEQVRSAGATLATLEPSSLDTSARLERLRAASDLDELSVSDGATTLLDAHGGAARPVDPLRWSPERLGAAVHGEPSVALDYEVGGLPFAVGYFPLPGARALVVEAGTRFQQTHQRIARARWAALTFTALAALALALVAARFVRLEQRSREAERRADFGLALQRLAAMAAHEVRTPVATMRGLLELFRERQRGAPDELVPSLLEELARLTALTNDLQDVSSERPLSAREVSLLDAVRAAHEATRASHATLKLTVPSVDATVSADPQRLHQVLRNVLRNAAQARLDATVTASLETGSSRVVLRLCDDGPGIPPAQRARLFEAFASEREGGHGLGLMLSRRLMERMGGTLRFVPTDAGACFELEFPKATR